VDQYLSISIWRVKPKVEVILFCYDDVSTNPLWEKPRRTETIIVRVTIDEKEIVRDVACDLGVTMSKLVRDLIFDISKRY
jgi:hypothetical protein